MPAPNDFESLIADNHPIIYKICRVYSGQEDFEDLYQEVLINLWKSFQSFEGRSRVSTWLYRVALNTALTYARNEKRRKGKVSREQLPPVPDAEGEAAEREQKIERLYDAISQLRAEDRSLILLYLEEKSYQEIASITGLTTSNVGVKLNRVKKKLFQLLKSSQDG